MANTIKTTTILKPLLEEGNRTTTEIGKKAFEICTKKGFKFNNQSKPITAEGLASLARAMLRDIKLGVGVGKWHAARKIVEQGDDKIKVVLKVQPVKKEEVKK